MNSENLVKKGFLNHPSYMVDGRTPANKPAVGNIFAHYIFIYQGFYSFG